jgi:hypothetical protein
METFNTFNRTQFDGGGPVDGHNNDATFGKVVNAAPWQDFASRSQIVLLEPPRETGQGVIANNRS